MYAEKHDLLHSYNYYYIYIYMNEKKSEQLHTLMQRKKYVPPPPQLKRMGIYPFE